MFESKTQHTIELLLKRGDGMMIANENYYVIQGFMLNDLKLKGCELNVFAIIHGFSQAKEQYFTGSLSYLAEFTGFEKRTIINTLTSLVKKGFIVKEEKTINGVKFCKYRTNFTGGEKIALPSEKSSPNNILSIFDVLNKIKENYVIGCKIFTTIETWLQYKIERGQPYKKKGLEGLLKQIETAGKKHGDQFVIDKIEQSIANNWQGLFFNDNSKLSQKRTSDFLDMLTGV